MDTQRKHIIEDLTVHFPSRTLETLPAGTADKFGIDEILKQKWYGQIRNPDPHGTRYVRISVLFPNGSGRVGRLSYDTEIYIPDRERCWAHFRIQMTQELSPRDLKGTPNIDVRYSCLDCSSQNVAQCTARVGCRTCPIFTDKDFLRFQVVSDTELIWVHEQFRMHLSPSEVTSPM